MLRGKRLLLEHVNGVEPCMAGMQEVVVLDGECGPPDELLSWKDFSVLTK